VPQPPGGFDIQIEAGLPLIRADAAQLERAIANVLDNATRYSAGEPVSVRARAAPNQLLLRVGDRGPGVAREDLERIFEPFHSPGEGSGTGLGLAIARGFLEANGGRIRAESLPGQGTTIVLTLPVPAEQPAEAHAQAAE
jgi:two-component system, OmpR family, sensor histidine kinase KdpD